MNPRGRLFRERKKKRERKQRKKNRILHGRVSFRGFDLFSVRRIVARSVVQEITTRSVIVRYLNIYGRSRWNLAAAFKSSKEDFVAGAENTTVPY